MAAQRSRAQEIDENYTSGLFRGSDANSFDLVNDPFAAGSLNIFQYLQGKVAGLQISGATGGGNPSLSWRGGTPTLFLNEMQVDPGTLQNTPVADIAYVKVFRPPFFGAPGGGAGGAIAVYTRKGNEQNNNQQSTPGLEKGTLVGYAAPKEFYSPDYSKESPLFEVTDVRATLYWASYILTDAGNRRMTITFYNNDVSTRLRVVLEGHRRRRFHVDRSFAKAPRRAPYDDDHPQNDHPQQAADSVPRVDRVWSLTRGCHQRLPRPGTASGGVR